MSLSEKITSTVEVPVWIVTEMWLLLCEVTLWRCGDVEMEDSGPNYPPWETPRGCAWQQLIPAEDIP